MVSLANLIAVGSSVGFTGNDKPLKNLESKLRARGGSMVGELQRRLHKLYRVGKIGVKTNASRRRAIGTDPG